MHLTKISAAVLLAAIATSAHAFVYSNLLSADTALKGFSGTGILTVTPPNSIGPGNTTALIDFFPNNVYAGGVSGQNTVNYGFSYDVSNPAAIGQVGLTMQGIIGGKGTVTFNEQVFKLVGGIISGPAVINYTATFTASTVDPRLSLSAGNFSFADNTGHFSGLTEYRVIKTMTVSVGTGAYDHGKDFAKISLIEQNHQPVPEPTTLVALGLGAIAAIRRRRS